MEHISNKIEKKQNVFRETELENQLLKAKIKHHKSLLDYRFKELNSRLKYITRMYILISLYLLFQIIVSILMAIFL